MYKIGEFSKITNLTVKTLHYYDSEGILTPSIRAENQYRYYNEEDYERAQLIILLKELDFSIAEIKELLTQYDDVEDLSYFLNEKKIMIQDQIKQKKQTLAKFESYTSPIHSKKETMTYEIVEKEISSMLIAYIPFKGKYQDVGPLYSTLFKAVKGKGVGTIFNLYYDEDYKESATLDVCIPVSSSVITNGVETKSLPAIKGISLTHTGSYDSLHYAYKALLDYANQHNLILDTPSREIYHKGPGMIFRGNPNKYVTELIIPIKEKQL